MYTVTLNSNFDMLKAWKRMILLLLLEKKSGFKIAKFELNITVHFRHGWNACSCDPFNHKKYHGRRVLQVSVTWMVALITKASWQFCQTVYEWNRVERIIYCIRNIRVCTDAGWRQISEHAEWTKCISIGAYYFWFLPISSWYFTLIYLVDSAYWA